MRELKVGDRVQFPEGSQMIAGTVIDVKPSIFSVRRDDDEPGAGEEYKNAFGCKVNSWLCSRKEYESGFIRLIDESANPHIMGLSPEEIDPDAYKSFMRDLQ